MEEEIALRAREIFFDQRVHHTEGSTGLLIYVSLFEHIAIVLADQEILSKLGQAVIDQLCEHLTKQLHHGDYTNAIASVIAEAGDQLATVLPRESDDVNELHDTLILID